jgi:hypothetical protein
VIDLPDDVEALTMFQLLPDEDSVVVSLLQLLIEELPVPRSSELHSSVGEMHRTEADDCSPHRACATNFSFDMPLALIYRFSSFTVFVLLFILLAESQ